MSEMDPEKRKADKSNTDEWKRKQDQKKKLKQAQKQGQGQESAKIDKKEKKKKKQEEVKEPEKAPSGKGEAKVEQKSSSRGDDKQSGTQISQEQSLPKYRQLMKIDSKLKQSEKESQVYQEELITKYMDQCVMQHDTILYVGSKNRVPTSQQVYVKGLNICESAELMCRYQDLSYFLEGTITKIFVQADYIFSNGSILAKQGALNVALMGKYHNIPVLAVGGSWHFNSWGPVSQEALEERYGGQNLKSYDWIEPKYLRSTILQVGLINPKQVSIYPPIIYKKMSLQNVEW